MLALYRSGRQVEALRAFDRHRRRLAEDVGVEPTVELRELEAAGCLHRTALLTCSSRASRTPRSRNDHQSSPLPLTSFVGRNADVETGDRRAARLPAGHADRSRRRRQDPPGVGSGAGPRAAARFDGGVRLVDLGSLGDGELLVSAVVREFALDTHHAPDDTTALLAALTHRPPNLIVLDNCEHLVRATAELVDAVLRSCPDVRVLATSRRPLGVSGECVRAVAPLPEADAVSLFVDRARLAWG